MNKPFFTVVIVSVLNQTFERFELIIVDDHSTDDTSSVASSFSDPRIQYVINHRTKGACGARNTGIFSAKGKWVAFLDDDDIWLPEKLKYQYELIQNAKQKVGLVCTDYAIFKGEGQKPKIYKNRPSGWVRDKLLYGGGIGCLSSTCIRSDMLRDIGGFDERFPSNQDQDLWLRVAEVSEFAHVPKTFVHMYQDNRKDRIGLNFKRKLDGWILFRDKYSELINKSLRLRHQYESHIFTYAFLQNDRSLVANSLPWVLLGLIIDLPNFFQTIRYTLFLTYKKNV
jgi:glycosyltransferase involved in cell wall biosynthesis